MRFEGNLILSKILKLDFPLKFEFFTRNWIDFSGILRKFDSRKSFLNNIFLEGGPFYEEVIINGGKSGYFLGKIEIFL